MIDIVDVDEAVLALLRAQVDGNNNPVRVGDAAAPEPPEGQALPATPYASLYPLDGSETGVMHTPHAHVERPYRVRVVGRNRRSAQALAGRLRYALIGRDAAGYVNPIAGSGFAVTRRQQLVIGGAVQEGLLWNVDDDFSCLVVPA